jgi:hypothetical protein
MKMCYNKDSKDTKASSPNYRMNVAADDLDNLEHLQDMQTLAR